MNPEKLSSLFNEKSRDESRRRALIAKAREIGAVQKSIIEDLSNFVESLLPEDIRKTRADLRAHNILPKADVRSSFNSIGIDDQYEDPELGAGTVVANIRALSHADGSGKEPKAEDYINAKAFGVYFRFEPQEQSQKHNAFVLGSEVFPTGRLSSHGIVSDWGLWGEFSLSKAEELVDEMNKQIVETGLRQSANETLELLQKAASNPVLNPELAERGKKAQAEELQEEA